MMTPAPRKPMPVITPCITRLSGSPSFGPMGMCSDVSASSAAPNETRALVRKPADFPLSSRLSPMSKPTTVAAVRRRMTCRLSGSSTGFMGSYILVYARRYPENPVISKLSNMEKLRLEPRSRVLGTSMPPGSKSIANRALPLAALAGATLVSNLPDGDDVVLMQKALAALGAPLSGSGIWENLSDAPGNGGFRAPEGGLDLLLGNSGTATRILTALLAASEGVFRVDGVARMRERPIGDLIDALRPLCGDTRIHYEGREGFPPLRIEAKGLAGGKTRIRGNLSSQFVTGLLMAMPLCRGAVEVEIEGTL